MRKIYLLACILMFMLILIGTAYADWFTAQIITPPPFPEYAALIGLGAVMLGLGAYGRRAISENRPLD